MHVSVKLTKLLVTISFFIYPATDIKAYKLNIKVASAKNFIKYKEEIHVGLNEQVTLAKHTR